MVRVPQARFHGRPLVQTRHASRPRDALSVVQSCRSGLRPQASAGQRNRLNEAAPSPHNVGRIRGLLAAGKAQHHYANRSKRLLHGRNSSGGGSLYPQIFFYSHMPSVVLRAEAYRLAGDAARAAEQWRIILRNPGITQLSATAPYARVQLADASGGRP